MFLGGLKTEKAEFGPSWNEVEKLSDECQDLVEDVNAFIASNFPEMKSQPSVVQNSSRDDFERPQQNAENRSPLPAEPTPSESPASTAAPRSAPAAGRKSPDGVLGAVCENMSSAKSAWESYEDAYEASHPEPYKGRGFERYFTHGVENRSNLRIKNMENRNFDNRYYDYHYLEHHLRENDDERLADRMRSEERMSTLRADERAHNERESALDAERRTDLELDRRDDYRMTYDD